MDVELTLDVERNETLIIGTPGHYDAQPLFSHLSVSSVPVNLHPDRVAVASALLFLNEASGVLQLDRACSPYVAKALREFFVPVEVNIAPVTLEPRNIALGDETLYLLAQDVNDSAPSPAPVGGTSFSVFNNGVGALVSSGVFTVVSNAGLMVDPHASVLRRVIPALAIAVLFAEDFSAGAIFLPGVNESQDEPLMSRLVSVVDACGLRLLS